ncbi:MAG: AI-2E family transporter [Thermomicrobiales bacterium]
MPSAERIEGTDTASEFRGERPSSLPSIPYVMLCTVAVIAVLALGWLAIQIRAILLLLVLAVIFAAAIEPLVFRLRRAGLGRGQAILSVYLGLVAILALTIYVIVPQLVGQITAFDKAIPDIFNNLREQALETNNTFMRRTAYQSLWRIENTYEQIRNSPQIGQDQALGLATSVVGVFFTIISMLVISYYWMTEKATIKRVVLGLFPFSKRARAHTIWDEIEYKIGGWTRGQLALMFIIGSFSGVAYYFLDIRFWLPLAIWAGLTEAIPFIGPFIGGGTAALVALASSPEKAILVIIFAIVLQQLEGALLVPRIMRNAVVMSPLTVILAVLIGSSLSGPLGALVAIPIGAAIQVLISNLLRLRDDRIESELRTMEIAPLSASAFHSPFAATEPDTPSRVLKPDPVPKPSGISGGGLK